MNNSASPPAASVPVVVGITGKRKNRLDELAVSEAAVRGKLVQALRLVQELTPNSPKLLLCGMADGVDEIAARLVIQTIDQHDATRREFADWSVIGLLPMPEEAFLEDFPPGQWWYQTLDDDEKKLIRLMPLQTLGKNDSLRYAPEDLRRQGEQNVARSEHYEQLGLVLAERSTVLLAVMPENEKPDRPGGTAQVVAHRLNGWRQDWPLQPSRHIAQRSNEFVARPPLATPVASDVWLVPLDRPLEPVVLRALHARKESEPIWPKRIRPPHTKGGLARLRRLVPQRLDRRLNALWPSRDILISNDRQYPKRAHASCPLLRPLNAFNRRATSVKPRPVPSWDDTMTAHPADPAQWSPLAAAARLQGTFSDIQGDRKARLIRTVTQLSVIALVSITLLESYAELFEIEWKRLLPDDLPEIVAGVFQAMPFIYFALILTAMFLYTRAVRRSWAAIAEDYRLLAEALRIQIVLWRIGVTARHDRVDNIILRYDTGAFQLLRRGLATALDVISFMNAKLPAAPDLTLKPASDWILEQIRYHEKTEKDRKRRYGRQEFAAWSVFGSSLAMAVWLAAYVTARFLTHQFKHLSALLETMRYWFAHNPNAWVIAVLATLAGAAVLAAVGKEDLRSPELAFRAPNLFGAGLAGIFFGITVAALWAIFELPPEGLRKFFFLGSVLLLAAAGIIRYRTEKIAIEAEAQGSEMALPIYRRAKAAFEAAEAQFADPEHLRRHREQIIRDLGEFALAETEAWLRSHRERPLHPALG